ncbi:unnamed protein product [Phytomonas sp. EM1]|nr:unnamed protein product [Phytomonas sp. EM1]|eukprot:CCW62305.1 unnamed protein product [Phytomonas sp. isolate EM1]
MGTPRVPIVGQTYSVVCPSCCTTVSFVCDNVKRYGIECHACREKINLENPHSPLPPSDEGYLPHEHSAVVCYSPEVEESGGLSAAAQVCVLIQNVDQEIRKEMPERMTEESAQAFSSKRIQKFSNKFFFLFPVVWAVEYLLFGRKPYATIGHVRLFRKYIPFKGYVYIPAPTTTTSSAMPLVFSLFLFASYLWFCAVVDEGWLYQIRNGVLLGAVGCFFFALRVLFADPGYVRPGYMAAEGSPSHRTRRDHELSLKELEANKRESKWETVNGVAMERKWCSTCEMYRPVRAAHCYHCGLCCYEHDHHCGVLGICVGRRNAFVFMLFVMSVSCVIITVLISMIDALYMHTEKLSLEGLFFSCVLLLMFGVSSLTVGAVVVSMWLGFAFESTTRERIQNVYAAKRNPFSRGTWRNLKYHLWDQDPAASLFDENFVKSYMVLYGKREFDDPKAALL